MTKRKKKKPAPIFPPETGEVKAQPLAMQSPADAAALASGFAGLGAMGSINEDMDEFLQDLRFLVWELTKD